MLVSLFRNIINSLRNAFYRMFKWIYFENRITHQTSQQSQENNTNINTENIEESPLKNPTNQQLPNGYSPHLPLYSLGTDSYEYNSESYQWSHSDDDGWNSDPDTIDPTLRYHSPSSPTWMTSQDFINYIDNISEYELLNELHSCWLTNKKFSPDDFTNILHHLLVKYKDPYTFTIIFIQRMKKFKMGRNSPCKLCLTALEDMLNGFSPDFRPILTQTHQIQALEVGVFCPPSILDEMCRIFLIDSLSVVLKCKVMKDLITANLYKEAIVSITRFGLQSFFSVEELLPPLIATDQINLIERYLGSDRNLQIQFIMLLDKLCSPNVDYLRLYSYYKSGGFAKGDTTNSKLSEHQIQRLAGRLIKTYELDASHFVHFTTAKVSSFTSSLLLRYYCGKGNACEIHEKNWIDLLTASVAQREELQINLIEELVRFNDFRIATYFMKLFNLAHKLPKRMAISLANTRPHNPHQLQRKSHRESLVRFYPLNLPFDCIVMVDTPAKLGECEEFISKRDSIIGIDAEWLMPLCNFGILRLALLQLATTQFIFLLDMVALTGAVSESQQISFIKSLFHSPHTIKLGFAIDGDLKMLRRTWPCVTHLLANPVSTIDLQKVASRLRLQTNGAINNLERTDECLGLQHSCSEEEFSTQSLFQKTSLNHVIEECFGFPMDKSNQIANWEKRPIRDDMKIYASLDAFCLIELFQFFRSKYGDSIFYK